MLEAVELDGRPYIQVNNDWDKDFETLDELVDWLNENGFDYTGVD